METDEYHQQARANKSKDKPDSELNEFDEASLMLAILRVLTLHFKILKEHRRQGVEDQALEKRVEGKKAAAKKRASRRSK